jgi:flagellar biosynthesis/type III secretory pathway protein FliH
MTRTLTVHLKKPIVSAKSLDNSPLLSCEGRNGEQQTIIQDSETHNESLSQACQTLKDLIEKLNQFYDKLFAEHNEEIAKLSVEIARKVLARQVRDGDYEIESIVREALKNAPTRKDLVVHLNPEDHILLQKALQHRKESCGEDSDSDLAGIKFISDSNIGRAECLLETPKGIIESQVNEHLERIGNALNTAG